MDEINLMSFHLDLETYSFITPTRGSRRSRESSSSLPLSPASSTPVAPYPCQLTHTYASHLLSTLPLPPSHHPLNFCALMNSLSINSMVSEELKPFELCVQAALFKFEQLQIICSTPLKADSDGHRRFCVQNQRRGSLVVQTNSQVNAM